MLKYVIVVFLFPFCVFAQEVSFKKPKQDLFFGMDAALGIGVDELIRKKNDIYDQDNNDNDFHFTYGVNAFVGYHFIPHLSFSTGLKYAYVTPNFHPIYWTCQSAYHFNLTNENTAFAALYFGNKINHTTIPESILFGIKGGLLTPKEKFLNLTASGFIEYQSLDGYNSMMVGLNVGFTIFSGTNNL